MSLKTGLQMEQKPMIEVKFDNNSTMILPMETVKKLFGNVINKLKIREVPEEELDLEKVRLRNLQFDNLVGALDTKWKEEV